MELSGRGVERSAPRQAQASGPATLIPPADTVRWQWLRRPTPANMVLLFLLVAAAHGAGTELAYTVNRVTSDGVSLFPAAGVTVALLLLVPRRSWPVVLAATFLAELAGNFLIGEVVLTAVGSALSNTVEPALGALVVLHLLGGIPSLSRQRHLVAFIAGAVVAGPALGAVVGAASAQFTAGHPPFFDILGRWFTGDALGVLVIGSLIMAWAGITPVRVGPRNRWLEGPIAVIAVVALTVAAFWWTSPALAYLALPPLGWASLRFGVRGATSCGACIALLADWATLRGHGLFAVLAGVHHEQALWQLQLFLGVLLLTALVLAAQVTELGEAEKTLRTTEEQRKLSLLLELSPDPVWILEPDGTVDYVNRQLEILTNRTRDQLIGRPFGGLLSDALSEESREKLTWVAGAPAGSRWMFEIPGLGEVVDRSLEVAISPLDAVDGRVLVATIRDVTERREAEVALRSALDTAEQATRVKSEFLATMSHEIRTPMNGVIGMVDVLRRSALDPSQAQMVATIGDSAFSLLAIIDDILDFSKIEAGKLVLEASPLSIRDVIDSLGELLASAAATKNLELVCTVDPSVPEMVEGDALRLRQILFNLVGNAIKFTEKGSVRLRVNTEGDRIRFAVTDTGIGITEEQQAALFQPFVQAEQSTTRRFGGSGLGLSIVARLVELMGSTVRVTSKPGVGSSFGFAVELPASDSSPLPKPLAGRAVAAVVSDRPADQAAIEALHRSGARVTTVNLAGWATIAADAVYLSRSACSAATPAELSALEAGWRGRLVVDRGVDGRVLVAWADAVETSAVTGSSIVRAVVRATSHAVAGPDGAAAGRAITDGPAPSPVGDVVPTYHDLVLVAEDNATNQMVIRHQLRALGFACEIAADGIEAFELARTGRFALVLADIHMPRLDGHELTRMIREWETGTGGHLPVVALTASALPSERERCLSVGMDDVLTKPIEIDRLRLSLRQVFPYLTTADRPATARAISVPAVTVDLDRLKESVGDDPDEVAAFAALFQQLVAESVAIFDAGQDAGSTEVLRAAAHKLRGSAVSIGADRLAELCLALESGGASDPDAIRHELAQVAAAVAHHANPVADPVS